MVGAGKSIKHGPFAPQQISCFVKAIPTLSGSHPIEHRARIESCGPNHTCANSILFYMEGGLFVLPTYRVTDTKC